MRKRWAALVVLAVIVGSFSAFSFLAGYSLDHNSTVPIIVTGSDGTVGIGINPSTGLVYEGGCTLVKTSDGGQTCASKLFVISASTNEVVATVPLPPHSGGAVAVDPVTNMVYLAGYSGVIAVNGATDQIVANISAPAAEVAVDPATDMVYASFFNYTVTSGNYYSQVGDGLTVIDGESNKVVSTLPTLGGEYGAGQVAVDPATDMVYVAGTYDKSGANGTVDSNVSVVNGTDNTVVRNITINEADGTGAEGIAVDSSTDMVYASTFSLSVPQGDVVVIDGKTDSVVANIPLLGGSHGVTVNENTDTIYATLAGGTSVSVINGATNSVASQIRILSSDTGQVPDWLAFDPSTDTLYVCFGLTDYTAVINDAPSA